MSPPATVLSWDSEFFGFKIARVSADRLTAESVPALLAWARAEEVECLHFLATADDPETIRQAGAADFRLVDIRVELDRALDRPPDANTAGDAAAGVAVRRMTAADFAALQPVAPQLHHDSRFYADARIPRERADALFRRWLEASFEGEIAEAVLVAGRDGAAEGYLTVDGRPEVGRIGLVGVTPAAQGGGIGRVLVAAALEWFGARGKRRVTVATQGRNVRAQRLYQRSGFVTARVGLWYHRYL